MGSFTPAIGYTSLCISITAYVAWHLMKSRSGRNAIPLAQTSSRLPYIGQILEYKADPLAFILKQTRDVGEVFRLNLVFMNITFLVGAKVSFSQSRFEDLKLIQRLYLSVEPLDTQGNSRSRRQPYQAASDFNLWNHQ